MRNSIFCPKCHKLTAEIIRTEEKIMLRQNGKTLFNLSKDSKMNNIGIGCPSGHSVKVQI